MLVLAEMMIMKSPKLQPSNVDHQQKRYTVSLQVERNFALASFTFNVFMEVTTKDQSHLKRIICPTNISLGFY